MDPVEPPGAINDALENLDPAPGKTQNRRGNYPVGTPWAEVCGTGVEANLLEGQSELASADETRRRGLHPVRRAGKPPT